MQDETNIFHLFESCPKIKSTGDNLPLYKCELLYHTLLIVASSVFTFAILIQNIIKNHFLGSYKEFGI
jgi:hypothetical protein